jgi:p-aminobenzoyl-glutamate transporter AbgT
MYKKVLAYLALTLGIAEVGVVLVSWLLTAAMPESFTHSLTSAEGIRWFTGHFVDHLTSAWLVWLVLISISIGVVKQSRVLHFDHTQYRQRTALRLMLFELVFFVGILLALTLMPHAILLNAVGTLLPGPFTQSLIPYICFSVVVMSMSYGIMSESIKGICQVYDAMNQGIRLLSPCFLFYILVMQLYTSVLYVMG